MCLMTENWILAEKLWGLIIVFYDRFYEDNTEEIYEILLLFWV